MEHAATSSRTCHLGELPIGRNARILSLDLEADPAYGIKLLNLGFTPGTSLKVIRSAPLGDPIEVEIRGYCLALRRAEVSVVQVEVDA